MPPDAGIGDALGEGRNLPDSFEIIRFGEREITRRDVNLNHTNLTTSLNTAIFICKNRRLFIGHKTLQLVIFDIRIYIRG